MKKSSWLVLLMIFIAIFQTKLALSQSSSVSTSQNIPIFLDIPDSVVINFAKSLTPGALPPTNPPQPWKKWDIWPGYEKSYFLNFDYRRSNNRMPFISFMTNYDTVYSYFIIFRVPKNQIQPKFDPILNDRKVRRKIIFHKIGYWRYCCLCGGQAMNITPNHIARSLADLEGNFEQDYLAKP
ncbi:MAG: hypothetical protein PHT40_00665 [Patescibacteria group bacterium]|nr:hypothetical protein [Patescibacteria group bacterium]